MQHRILHFVLIASLIACSYSSSFGQGNDPQVDQVRTDLKKVGLAIERLYQDKGVSLVDLMDDDNPEGIAQIQTMFEGVGMPVNGVRTMRDVLQPLVHFGYLDSLPSDPFIPTDTTPEWNTFIYVDEDGAAPPYDGYIPFAQYSRHEIPTIQNWFLISPGPDGVLDKMFRSDDLITSRYQLYMQPPLVEQTIQRQQEAFRTIGNAIETLRAEKGVLLVDGWDDDIPEGRERLQAVFQGVGDVPEAERGMDHIFAPLVHFSYLQEIPLDPILAPYPMEYAINPLYQQEYFLYADQDPGIPGLDTGLSLGGTALVALSEGEWALRGYKPLSTALNPSNIKIQLPDPIVYNLFLISDLTSHVDEWELMQ